MWALGEAERRAHYAHRGSSIDSSDKLRKFEKQDKLDKLERLELMDGSDRVKHLEAQMLSKIKAMDLEPKMMDLLMDEQEVCSLLSRLQANQLWEYVDYWIIVLEFVFIPP